MPLDSTITGDDPFEKANAHSKIMFAVTERKVGWQRRDSTFAPISTHKAIVRVGEDGKTPHVLNVVGAGYKLVHNRELFGLVEDTMRKKMRVNDLHGVQILDKVAGWGRVCLREYVFPNIKCVLKGGARSSIAFRLIVQNGYGGSALRLHAGAIEFYCTNGLISGEYQSAYHKHTSGLVVVGVDASVDRALHTFADSQVRWQRWVDTPVKHEAAMQLFRELAVSEKMTASLTDHYIQEREDRGPNLWSVYSTLTYYASHASGDFGLRKSVTEQDSAASVMLQRELAVAKVVSSDAWHRLEAV